MSVLPAPDKVTGLPEAFTSSNISLWKNDIYTVLLSRSFLFCNEDSHYKPIMRSQRKNNHRNAVSCLYAFRSKWEFRISLKKLPPILFRSFHVSSSSLKYLRAHGLRHDMVSGFNSRLYVNALMCNIAVLLSLLTRYSSQTMASALASASISHCGSTEIAVKPTVQINRTTL
jgi:hypothetical protein